MMISTRRAAAWACAAFVLAGSQPVFSEMPAAAPQTLFILDPGHGGDDLGAVVAGRREKDIALAIALKVKQQLEAEASAKVRLTRDTDVFVPLSERVGESSDGTAFVSLHLNQVRRKRQQGITVFAFGHEHFRIARRRHRHHQVPPLPAPPREEALASAELARDVVRALRTAGFHVEPLARAGFYVLKNPYVPSVLIELGYLSNPREASLLSDPAYQDRLARAIAESLQAYAATPAPKPDARLEARARGAPRGR